ncbi:MAG: putative small heat shock protein [Chloroflexi bacterium]|nr:putative small heat shock protein [Chloroflexota bacterium]
MSNLTRWDPMRDMMTLRNAMDHLFNSAFVGPDFVWQPETLGIPMDVVENDDAYIVKASLPGIKPEELEITYNNNVLTVKGETKDEKEVDENRYHLRERRYGSFSRSISLPSNVKADKIQADYEQGVLTLTLPKAEEAKPKRIQVKTSPMIEAKISDRKN